MTKKEYVQQQKLIKTIKKKFADEYIELYPWDNEEILCSTLNIVANDLNLPLRFDIVWTENECWIFTYIKDLWDIYLGKFSSLSDEWVADTVWKSWKESERLEQRIQKIK